MSDTALSPTGIPVWARGVRSLVLMTGAGISTASGIQDFRGASGAWKLSPGAQHRNTYRNFMAEPELRAAYWRTRFAHPWDAAPNAAHFAVAELANSALPTTIVTQNTDGLHQKAGTPPDLVIELHGTMHVVECVGCKRRSPTAEVISRIAAGEEIPACLRCGGILKTASTMFGQTMDPEVFARAQRAVVDCDLVIAAGTTLMVEPAASLCATAVRAGATLVIANWDPTPYDGIATDIIRDSLVESLPRIARQLLAGAAEEVGSAGGHTGGGETASPRPSDLLAPRARTARWHSRTDELERLAGWCTGAGAPMRALCGPAGSGKTRLAIELGQRLEEAGWEVRFLPPRAGLPHQGSGRPILAVIEDAETRRDQVAQVAQAMQDASTPADVRVLLLARARDASWDTLMPGEIEEIAVPVAGVEDTGVVSQIFDDYAATLTGLGFSPDLSAQVRAGSPADTPGEVQSAVFAALLGEAEPDGLVRHELAYLRQAGTAHGLTLSAETVAGAAATAILCGAADSDEAHAALDWLHGPDDTDDTADRARICLWLKEMYPPAESASPPLWADEMPDPVSEDLVTSVVTPQFLLRMLGETTEEQDRRALKVLARAAATRPKAAACLVELLSVLPGLSPAAVDAALTGGHPQPLAQALIGLARTAALPAELLELVPPGTTVLGEFPVLLAESLVEAYQARLEAYPESAGIGLTTMLLELSGRLADLGEYERALTVAQQAADAAAKLPSGDGYRERIADALRRVQGQAHG